MTHKRVTTAYKLVHRRKDGTLGPLFINCPQRIPLGVWLEAEDHPRKGYKHRPGWHASVAPYAPHLSEKERVWVRVELQDAEEHIRPAREGGLWFVAGKILVHEILTEQQVATIRMRMNIKE